MQSPPNTVLMAFADRERRRGGTRALDIGCGAGRNAVPLARQGWQVIGVDLTWAMLCAAAQRTRENELDDHLRLVCSPMDGLPVRDDSCDLVIAHGIWNLARSAAEFRRAVQEAARVARTGAGLFVFTFSRGTLPPDAQPVPGEPFVFTQFSGEPQCFLTEEQLVSELGAAGFVREPSVPLNEYNLQRQGSLPSGAPVVYEAAFRLNAKRRRRTPLVISIFFRAPARNISRWRSHAGLNARVDALTPRPPTQQEICTPIAPCPCFDSDSNRKDGRVYGTDPPGDPYLLWGVLGRRGDHRSFGGGDGRGQVLVAPVQAGMLEEDNGRFQTYRSTARSYPDCDLRL